MVQQIQFKDSAVLAGLKKEVALAEGIVQKLRSPQLLLGAQGSGANSRALLSENEDAFGTPSLSAASTPKQVAPE